MVNSTLFTKPGYKKLISPLIDEWLRMCYIYAMEYYSFLKNEILPFAATWMDLERLAGA